MTEKIMFVDDDPSILDAAKTAIESYGYEVITASSGEECLDKVGDADLVFLDIKMPGMNGIEVLKKIKERYPSLPVIMITAYATVDTAIEAMKLGAFDYVRKPFAIEELEGSILAALEEIKFEKLKKLNFKVENHMERFKELLKEGKGICITREPEIVKGMGNVRVVNMMNEWEPKDMERIKEEIENYVEEGIPILMTDVEYLMEKFSSNKVRNFMKWLYKISSSNKCELIFSTDFSNIDGEKTEEIKELIADARLGLFSESISNYLRRKTIQLLSDGEKYSFTKIAQALNIKDNPKLSFHLKKLKDDGVIEQDEEKRYFLSDIGKEIADVLEDIKRKGTNI